MGLYNPINVKKPSKHFNHVDTDHIYIVIKLNNYHMIIIMHMSEIIEIHVKWM